MKLYLKACVLVLKPALGYIIANLAFLLFSSPSRQCLLRENGDGGLVRRMTFSRMGCKFNVTLSYCS